MLRVVVLLVGICVSLQSPAAQVSLTLPNGLVALASHVPGRPDKAAVLLMHGFLQTYDFPTLYRLAQGLADEGHTVLAPNLTLGVTHRKQSLACEAIHTHTMERDGQEIAAWLAWLGKRHPGPVALVGHSIGSMVLLAYLDSHPKDRLSRYIGVSLVEGRLKQGEAGREALLKDMRARVAAGDRQPVTHQFSFCQKLNATPESHISYLSWSPGRILQATRRLRVPATFIMGSKDDRLGPDWIEQLRGTQARVLVVDGANHFMDGEYEFELLDLVLKELARP